MSSPRFGARTGPPAHEEAGRSVPVVRYLFAASVLVAGILVQYLPDLPTVSPVWAAELLNASITYGPGLLAFLLVLGSQPLRNAGRGLLKASLEGLRWYGLLGILSLLVLIGLAILYAALDPNFIHILQKNTPVGQTGSTDPWLWILLSFPIGLVEETLFRGFLFGGALVVFGTRRWPLHAVWTSALFAGVHLYYAQTYAEVSPVFYAQIFLLGLAFALAYFYSGGILVIIALLHGVFDATSFAQYLPEVGAGGANLLRYGLVALGGLEAALLYQRERGTAAGPVPGATVEGAPRAPMLPYGTLPFWGPEGPPPPGGEGPVPGRVVRGAPPAGPPAPSPGALPAPPHASPGTAGGTPTNPRGITPPPVVLPVPGSGVGFLPAHCSRCGAIVMGDVHGVPATCPSCGEGLRDPRDLPPPPASTLPPAPPGSAPVPGTAAWPSAAPGPAAWPATRATTLPEQLPRAPGPAARSLDSYPPGAWPPADLPPP